MANSKNTYSRFHWDRKTSGRIWEIPWAKHSLYYISKQAGCALLLSMVCFNCPWRCCWLLASVNCLGSVNRVFLSLWHHILEAPFDCLRHEAAGGLVLIQPSKTRPRNLSHQTPPALIIGHVLMVHSLQSKFKKTLKTSHTSMLIRGFNTSWLQTHSYFTSTY